MSAMTGTSTQRLSLVPLASRGAGRADPPDRAGRVAVSAYGLREGLLYRQMPEAMRAARPADRGLPAHGGGARRAARASATRSTTGCCRSMPGRPACGAPAGARRLPAARRQLAGASRLSRRALLRIGDPRQHRRHRPCRAGVPRAGAAQPLQGGGAGRGGRALRRAAVGDARGARRRCSAGRCGSGRCCRGRRRACSSMPAIARADGRLRADADAARRASSPARRWSGGCRRWRRGSTATRRS